jgi:undecaprenyl-diphosphatase
VESAVQACVTHARRFHRERKTLPRLRIAANVTFVQAMLLAVLQGMSELFPISSLGHTVLVPALLRWHVDEGSESFLAFVVVLHLGTALALVLFYRTEWIALIRGFVASVVRGRISTDRDERIAWLLVAGTIPVGILGVAFESSVKALFASPIPVSLFLLANGILMLVGEYLRRRQKANEAQPYRKLPELQAKDGVMVGFAQSLALLPGISRSGSAIVAGLLRDLHHEDAAHYSFLLATPVIFAASVLEIPKLFVPGAHVVLVEAIVGGILAGITAYASVAFLTRWFRYNDLTPFAWYCVLAGAASFVLFATKVIA